MLGKGTEICKYISSNIALYTYIEETTLRVSWKIYHTPDTFIIIKKKTPAQRERNAGVHI